MDKFDEMDEHLFIKEALDTLVVEPEPIHNPPLKNIVPLLKNTSKDPFWYLYDVISTLEEITKIKVADTSEPLPGYVEYHHQICH